MKHKSFLILFSVILSACKSNPHKAEPIQTEMAQAQDVSGAQTVGVKNEETTVLDTTPVGERLRDLQNSVYALEDRVYGTRKLGSLGLYGDLKSCRRKLASPQYGGPGTMTWSEPLDRVTDKEDEMKVGGDEKRQVVAVSEEMLKDRLQRFQSYRTILQKRSDEFNEKIEACQTELATKAMDSNQLTKVMVSEVPKTSIERLAINKYMCGFVKSEASLRAFMLNAFAQGWLSLGDYKLSHNLIAYSLKDAKGVSKDNALLFNGWRLAFDRKQVTIGELFNDGKDAKLVAWAFDRKADIAEASTCLTTPDGEWNP